MQDDRLSSFISLANARIKAKAIMLDLGHRKDPIRLDPHALMIVANSTRGPVRLADMEAERTEWAITWPPC